MEGVSHEGLVGRTIAGKYVIETFLGGGAMGAVFRARQTALEKVVAIKVMHGELAKDATFAVRFHREAKAASRLDHPNSMRVLDFGEEPDGLLYIAMELLEGRDLYKVIHEDWPLSEARIVEILSQALAALAVAHDMGVIHRDLKPENIMVLSGTNDEGKTVDVVKVCDFGIAKLIDNEPESVAADPERKPAAQGPRATTQGVVIGTPEYMSPEQAQGKKLDARSDIYSMGIILYQLLTGRVPFTGESAVTVVVKHVTEIPEPPRSIYAGVHPVLETVCLKAVAKSPDGRFSSAREMRSALRAALDGPPQPVAVGAATEPALLPSALGLAATAAFVAPDTTPGLSGTIPGPAGDAASASAPRIVVAVNANANASMGGTVPLGAVAEAPVAASQAQAPPEATRSLTRLLFGFGVALVLVVGLAVFLAVKLELMGKDAKDTQAAPSVATAPVPVPSSTTGPVTSSTVTAAPSSTSPLTTPSSTVAKIVKPVDPHAASAHLNDPVPTGPSATTAPAAAVSTAAPTSTTPPAATTTPPAPTAPTPAPLTCSVASVDAAGNRIARGDIQGIPKPAQFGACAPGMAASTTVSVTINFDESGRRRGSPIATGAGAKGACFASVANSVAVRTAGELSGSPSVVLSVAVTCK